ncbi:MAG: HNH endonuclease [Bacteroidetes bacterium]|nr:HNH endonuclease [Bacteroidota bacterium]
MALDKRIREVVFNKYNGYCAYCGDKLIKMQIDHIIPQSNFNWCIKNKRDIPEFLNHLNENDVNHIDNLNPSCSICNKAKDTFSLRVFRQELEDQLKRAKKYSRNYRFALKYGQVKETPNPIIFYFEKNSLFPIKKTIN